jgi:hypothetical protein
MNLSEKLPSSVLDTLRLFRVCELSTVAKDGTPIAWPVSARFFAQEGHFLLTTSIGLSAKAVNMRRNPKIGMLYSEPKASGLPNPTYVMVKGRATVLDGVHTRPDAVPGLEEYWLESIFKRQPASAAISSNPVMRWLMDWYYMRLIIRVEPVTFLWWSGGDMTQTPQKLEVQHVV